MFCVISYEDIISLKYKMEVIHGGDIYDIR